MALLVLRANPPVQLDLWPRPPPSPPPPPASNKHRNHRHCTCIVKIVL